LREAVRERWYVGGMRLMVLQGERRDLRQGEVREGGVSD
jgi:hypothetical protein